MSWAYCGTNRHGQEIGYGVSAQCDEPGCDSEIDRGLAYLCGAMHDDGESCNRYFCSQHLVGGAYPSQLCFWCAREWDENSEDEDESNVPSHDHV